MHATWNFRLTEICIEAGANVNIFNNYQESSLHIASQDNHVDVAELLLEHGADIDAANRDGWTSLHWACYHLYPAMVDLLLRHNLDIDIVSYDGRGTALQFAMFYPATSPNREVVLQLMATCAKTRVEASFADWIRLARNERCK